MTKNFSKQKRFWAMWVAVVLISGGAGFIAGRKAAKKKKATVEIESLLNQSEGILSNSAQQTAYFDEAIDLTRNFADQDMADSLVAEYRRKRIDVLQQAVDQVTEKQRVIDSIAKENNIELHR